MSHRAQTVALLLQELAAKFVQQEANSDPLITITRVDLSPDQRRAIIFFTTIPNAKEKDAQIFLERNGTEFRHFTKRHARLKYIPHVVFMLDVGERHRQHLDEVVLDLNSRKQS